MSREKKPFIPVDELIPQVSLEQVAQHYGTPLPELHRIGEETRTRCFLNCGKRDETGERVLAIQENHPAKQWHCHQYGCGKGGNLISLCDYLAPGHPSGGRPRGERFKSIAQALHDIVAGPSSTPGTTSPAESAPRQAEPPPARNMPLRDSPNQRARGLTELDRKFIVDVAAMPPSASRYFRLRPFLSSEVLHLWRAGYLPRDTGADKSGGTMRGNVVYPYLSETGEILTWFGRDPEFEFKHQEWLATDQQERAPEKFHFVKGFHRGLELFGQHRLREEASQPRLQELGLLLVEGPNDVIRLSTLGIPAVGLCSNTITREQAAKVAQFAQQYAGGIVTIFLDCDDEGETGMKQCLGYLAQLTPVRLAWTSRMHGGKFKDRQPESLSLDEWSEIADFLRAKNGSNDRP